jgi:hypothetical protein
VKKESLDPKHGGWVPWVAELRVSVGSKVLWKFQKFLQADLMMDWAYKGELWGGVITHRTYLDYQKRISNLDSPKPKNNIENTSPFMPNF